MVCRRKFVSLILIAYALILSGCGKQVIVEADDNVLIQDTVQLRKMAAPGRETWWNKGTAEQGSLSVDEVFVFLKYYGFDDIEPSYVYGTEEEGKQLELYYDAEVNMGCGIRYGDGEDEAALYGFVFSGCNETEWEYWNPFSVAAIYDNGAYTDTQVMPIRDVSGNRRVSDYEETYEYNAQGKLASYCFTGIIDQENTAKEREDILNIDFFYRAEGTLCEKKYSHNKDLLGTFYSEQQHFYDEQERLIYSAFFMSQSRLMEEFYLYEGDSSVPAYCLELNSNASQYVTFYQYVEPPEDWKWILDVPVDGKQTFLRQIGFDGEEEVFYEYECQPREGYSDCKISLYYNEEEKFGGGFYEPGKASKWCDAFVFHGVTTVDIKETDPYAVFAMGNSNGRYIGQLPVDELQEAFGSDSFYACDYENERLMRVYMYETHGGNDRFYIYTEERDTPSYCIDLDPRWCVTMFEFIQ